MLRALGRGWGGGRPPRDVEVKRTSKGRPYAVLRGRAKEVAAELGVRELPISLSYTHTEAVACAMSITEDSVRAAEARVDPMAELAQRFKDARAMLDDIDKPKDTGADPVEGEGGQRTGEVLESGAAADALPEKA